MSGITRHPLGHLLLPCPVIKVNSKLEQLNPGRITNGSDPSGLKIWVSVPGKESQPAEVPAKGKKDEELAAEEGNYEYHMISYKNKYCSHLTVHFVTNMFVCLYVNRLYKCCSY